MSRYPCTSSGSRRRSGSGRPASAKPSSPASSVAADTAKWPPRLVSRLPANSGAVTTVTDAAT
ncbi:MAG TPA: hypothetical protein VFQ85_08840 [Mycobacteriales bacterium]|jgi:hypothetical protein|nr:hypothetical protein [Mycobacteriales bacterium]